MPHDTPRTNNLLRERENFLSQFSIYKQVVDTLRTDSTPVKEIASRSDVSKSTIYNWKNGKVSSPKFATIIKIASHYGKRLQLVTNDDR